MTGMFQFIKLVSHSNPFSITHLLLTILPVLLYRKAKHSPPNANKGNQQVLPQVVVRVFLFPHFTTTVQYKEQNIFTFQGARRLNQVKMDQPAEVKKT